MSSLGQTEVPKALDKLLGAGPGFLLRDSHGGWGSHSVVTHADEAEPASLLRSSSNSSTKDGNTFAAAAM